MAEVKAKNGKGKSKAIFLSLLGLVILAVLVYGGISYYEFRNYVSTDDARIDGDIIAVSSKIPGKVSKLYFVEGDAIKSGQLLVELDPTDVVNQEKQARAAVGAAQAKAGATVEGARSQELRQAQSFVDANAAYAEYMYLQYQRAAEMVKSGAIPQSKYDEAKANYEALKGAMDYAQAKLDLAKAGARPQEIVAAEQQTKQAQGALDAVNSSMTYLKVLAPQNGFVGVKAVNPGEVIAAGQPLLYMADLSQVWVKANIEENYLYRVKVGERVDFTVDAYPGKTFVGKLESILPATQSQFSLIPTENAAGTFTKVVQRVPVKISVPADSGCVFRPGMSVYVKIYAPS